MGRGGNSSGARINPFVQGLPGRFGDGAAPAELAVSPGYTDLDGERERLKRDGERLHALIYPARSMIVVGGMPGSGKTTLIRRLSHQAKVISIDECLSEVTGLSLDQLRTTQLTSEDFEAGHRKLIAELESSSAPVIVDAPAVRLEFVNDYLTAAGYTERSSHLIFIDEPREVCEASRPHAESIPERSWNGYEHARRSLREKASSGKLLGFDSISIGSREALEGLRQLRFGD